MSIVSFLTYIFRCIFTLNPYYFRDLSDGQLSSMLERLFLEDHGTVKVSCEVKPIELNITGTIRSTGSLKPNYASRTQPFHEKNKHGQNKNIDRQTGQNSRKNSFYKDVK